MMFLIHEIKWPVALVLGNDIASALEDSRSWRKRKNQTKSFDLEILEKGKNTFEILPTQRGCVFWDERWWTSSDQSAENWKSVDFFFLQSSPCQAFFNEGYGWESLYLCNWFSFVGKVLESESSPWPNPTLNTWKALHLLISQFDRCFLVRPVDLASVDEGSEPVNLETSTIT